MKKEIKDKWKKGVIIVIAIAVFTYIVSITYQLFQNPTDTFLIENGSLSQEETAQGYIIRKETVIKGENYKIIDNIQEILK